MKRIIIYGSRMGGKSLMTEKIRDEYLKRNPKATIITTRQGEIVIEKYVEAKEIKSLRLTKI